MKTEKEKNKFERLSKHEMKQISGGDGPARIMIIVNGEVIYIWA